MAACKTCNGTGKMSSVGEKSDSGGQNKSGNFSNGTSGTSSGVATKAAKMMASMKGKEKK